MHNKIKLSEDIYNEWVEIELSQREDTFTEMWGVAENIAKSGNDVPLVNFLYLILETYPHLSPKFKEKLLVE